MRCFFIYDGWIFVFFLLVKIYAGVILLVEDDREIRYGYRYLYPLHEVDFITAQAAIAQFRQDARKFY